MKKLAFHGRRGFYSLRHSFATAAGESRDQVTVDSIMGHSDQSILETVHTAHPEAFRRMLRLVIDNKLARFRSVVRAARNAPNRHATIPATENTSPPPGSFAEKTEQTITFTGFIPCWNSLF